MTQEEWETEPSPIRLLEEVRKDGFGMRERRLFLAGCARLMWTNPRIATAKAFELLERFADGDVTVEERRAATRTLPKGNRQGSIQYDFVSELLRIGLRKDVLFEDVLEIVNALDEMIRLTNMIRLDRSYLCDLIRDIVVRLRVEESWRTSTVLALANTMYISRNFSPMPMLADALEDAGCEDAVILAHCREPAAMHVRGCWVVDAILEKR